MAISPTSNSSSHSNILNKNSENAPLLKRSNTISKLQQNISKIDFSRERANTNDSSKTGSSPSNSHKFGFLAKLKGEDIEKLKKIENEVNALCKLKTVIALKGFDNHAISTQLPPLSIDVVSGSSCITINGRQLLVFSDTLFRDLILEFNIVFAMLVNDYHPEECKKNTNSEFDVLSNPKLTEKLENELKDAIVSFNNNSSRLTRMGNAFDKYDKRGSLRNIEKNVLISVLNSLPSSLVKIDNFEKIRSFCELHIVKSEIPSYVILQTLSREAFQLGITQFTRKFPFLAKEYQLTIDPLFTSMYAVRIKGVTYMVTHTRKLTIKGMEKVMGSMVCTWTLFGNRGSSDYEGHWQITELALSDEVDPKVKRDLLHLFESSLKQLNKL